MSLRVERTASAAPERPSTIGGSTRFVPGQSHDRITVVNGKVQLGQRLKDLWINRDLLFLLIRTELKVKYKDSVLGYAWSMLNPTLVLAIYYVVFKIIARNHQPNFAIWLFAGLLVWNLFNAAAMGSTGVVVGKSAIVKKVAFPRELLALSVVGVTMVLFAIQVVVLILAMLIFHIHPDYLMLAVLPLALVTLIVFTGALSVFLSAVNVYLRDTQHLTEVLLMAWFWGTSIVYTYGQIFLVKAYQKDHPSLHWLQYVYLVNPITPIVMTFQRAIYGRTQYSWLQPGSRQGDEAVHLPRPPHLGAAYLRRPPRHRAGGQCRPLPLGPGRLRPARGQLRRGALTGGRHRHRGPGHLQAVPPLQREAHVAQGTGDPRRQDAIHPVLGPARRDRRHQPGRDLRDPRPQRVRQVDPAQVRGRHPQAHLRRDPGPGQSGRHAGARRRIPARSVRVATTSSSTARCSVCPARTIEKRFDDIVAFAELEDFIDNQVKFYSSGMYVRLGFAVAVNVEPDVLLVDEVLAVGDAAFQRKCLDHVKKFQREGRTIVVVSHGTDTIRQNCDRAMVMNHGQVITVDEPGEAIRVYLADLLGRGHARAGSESGGIEGNVLAIGTVQAEHGASGSRVHIYPGESLTVTADLDSLAAVPNAMATIAIHDDKNELVFASDPGRSQLCRSTSPRAGASSASTSLRSRCSTAPTR